MSSQKTTIEHELNIQEVSSFDQIKNGDSLLVAGIRDGIALHLFHKITLKVSGSDGKEVILQRKGNIYFNFDMFLRGESWVNKCYKLTKPE